MPNATWRYKMLLVSVLLVVAKFFDFTSVPRMGFACSLLGHILLRFRSLPRRSFRDGGSTDRAEGEPQTVGHGGFDHADDCHFQSGCPPGANGNQRFQRADGEVCHDADGEGCDDRRYTAHKEEWNDRNESADGG